MTFISQVYPPAGVIFSGIGVLLSVSVLFQIPSQAVMTHIFRGGQCLQV